MDGMRFTKRKYFAVKNETGYFGDGPEGRQDKYEAWRFTSKELAVLTAGKNGFYGEVVEIELELA